MMEIKEINFDMDGTIADLYGVDNWLGYLINEDTLPYQQAKPLVNMSQLARQLNRLSRNGYNINIISWLSKNGSQEYNEKVAQVKRQWLSRHLKSVKFESIHILRYGTPKEQFGSGILFDDEQKNRENWNGQAYDVQNILEVLRGLD